MLDQIMNRQEMLDKSDEEVHHILNEMYPDRHLSNHSTAWRDDEKYILKARGAYGDVIIGWEGVHDESH